LAKVNIYIKDPYVAKYITEEKITEIAFVGQSAHFLVVDIVLFSQVGLLYLN
jgi:hypothetical protein